MHWPLTLFIKVRENQILWKYRESQIFPLGVQRGAGVAGIPDQSGSERFCQLHDISVFSDGVQNGLATSNLSAENLRGCLDLSFKEYVSRSCQL
jgi:hypothetical protein